MAKIAPGLKISISNTPQARDDTFSFNEDVDGSILSLNVLANDLGGNAKRLYSLFNGAPPADLSSLLAGSPSTSIVSTLTGATVSINADGTIHYDTTGLDFQYLDAGETLTDTFTYVIRLGNGAFSVATATVTITGETDTPTGNHPPTGAVTINGTAAEDQVLTADVTTLADADGLGTISYQWQRDGLDIGGATGATYTLGDADVGHTITVVASYTDGHGTAESVSSVAVGPIANVNDAPTGAVTISGTAAEDQVLTADASTLADADGLGTISYQWQRDGSDIGGATGLTYTLGDADVGHTITVVASYTDGHGTAESVSSAAVGPIANVNDGPTGAVTISGTAAEDQVLTADASTIADADGLGTISFQWQRDGSDIGGATGATYTLGDADVGHTITVVASYTDGYGTAESLSSAAVGPIANVNDAPTGAVTVSGTAAEDQVLTADASTLADADGLGTISYQWQRDGSDIGGATGPTYTPGDADVGHTITVVPSYTDGHGTAESVSSVAVGPIANVNDAPTGAVTISGTAAEDQVLTADASTLADADGLGPISYQWQRDGSDIGGATGLTYTLGDADVGHTVSVVASYTDGYGTAESATSAAVGPIANVNDAPTGAVTISGTAAEDQVLTADVTSLADSDGLGPIGYQWQRDGSDIGGATGVTYTLGDADVGHTITVVASYTDGYGTGESIASADAGPVANVNDAPTGVVTISGMAAEDQVLTADAATLADADGLGTIGYQWQRDGLDIGGATGLTYTLDDADVGHTISVVASYTDGQGTAESISSAAVGPVANVNDAPTGAVTISGTAAEDQLLTADVSSVADADGLGPISYQWQRDGSDIGGATGLTYALDDADVGHTISVVVSYTDGQGTAESVPSAAVGPVANVNDAPTGAVTISGTPAEDQVLTANAATLADADGLGPISYQWQRDGSDIGGATGLTYTVGDADVGHTITVVASYTDGHGTAESIPSAAVGPVAGANDAPVLNTAASPALAPVLEDAAAPSGAVGTLVSDLVNLNPPAGGLDNVVDSDPGAATGIALTAVGGGGSWFYSTNNGGSWTAVGTVSSASALLLAADSATRLYFRPTANFDGDSTLTFRAWDQTSGAAGTKVDTTTNGGSSAFSTATDVATIDVTSVNDAPAAGNDVVAKPNQLASFSIPEWALLRNDTDIDSPITLDVNGASVGSDFSSVSLTPGGVGTGAVNVADSGGVGGTLFYQATDGSLLSGTATVTVGTTVSSTFNGTGWDVIGGVGNTILIGTANSGDRLSASTGNDILIGGPGNDPLLSGIAGNDWYGFNLNDGTDTIFDASSGGAPAGTDRVIINASSAPALTTLSFERMPTTIGNMFVDELRITYTGGVITVTDHYNTSIGSMDQMQFLGGASFLGYSLGTGVYNIVADGSPTAGTNGNDVIASSSAAETLTGAGGNDLMFGNAGNDTLNGGTGNDLLVGGANNDTYAFAFTGDGTDTIGEAGGGTDGITIAAAGAAMTALNFEHVGNDLVLGYNGQQVTVVNHYAGAAVEQITFTGGGTIYGYALGTTAYNLSTDASSPLDGTAGLDVIASSTAGETLNGSTGNDLLFGNAGIDIINGGDGNDLVVGGTGADTLSGGNNDDVLVGGADADVLNGDAGDDRFVFTAASDSTLSAMDTIAGFTAAGTEDVINLDAFDFTGTAAAALKSTSPGAFTAADAADFFDDSGTDRAVAVEYSGGNARVFVDANHDGNFSAANDLVVQLNGVAPNSLTVNDFLLG